MSATYPCRIGIIAAWLATIPVAMAQPDSPPATVTQDLNDIIMDNGIVLLTISKQRGEVRSIKCVREGTHIELSNRRDAMYMDFNGGPDVVPDEQRANRPRGGYLRPMFGAEHRILSSGPDAAEVAFFAKPSLWFPFAAETHWVLPRGQSGFYAYVIYHHGPGMPAGRIDQTRMVIKGAPGTNLLTHWIVDDRRARPRNTGRIVQNVQDATVRYEDGTVFTKYDNSAFTCDYLVHGMAGNGTGIWMCWPSVEFCNGGPLRQDLTVHDDNTLLAMFLSRHFGAGGAHLSDDELWTQFYGPVFVYINHGDSVEKLHADAKNRANQERANWPYQWLKHDDYPLQRGTVRGRIKLADGSSAAGAWVVLGPNHEPLDWPLSAKGYMFWTKADSDGRFEIENVRPGKYAFWVSGADQFVDFRQDDVEVKPDQITDLKTLDWQPITHGKRLWQIGVADRGSSEFMDGDNPRNYDTFLNYFKAFPDDVTFTIGQSDPKKDWYYAQWTWYSQRPQWTIRFDLPDAPKGKATLTLGFASTQPAGELVVRVNRSQVASLKLPKTGAAAYRSASQDSPYTVREVTFDASLLKHGSNQITLAMTGSRQFPGPEELAKLKRPNGAVMYDAIRLEVGP